MRPSIAIFLTASAIATIVATTIPAAEVPGSTHMPNPQLTPGTVRPELSTRTICATKWSQDPRFVTQFTKLEVYRAYGYSGPKDPRCPCEIDHLVARELGGSDAKTNLWPQPYFGPWNAHMKDRLENRLHADLCSSRIDLATAQSLSRDWIKTYIKYFGTLK